uniref:CRAL-TRIO domain-containing protein n=1 Tax=Odontella aurita TaxID=265563 RepID=A0A7S4MXM3_9STRA|mmetsp:Transcript_3845/g.10455  ORF Transcript_3845/g.10455 Transcript_3845/m.10455 type:complete len:236 (+) Transcript_3845:3-710(+)
MREDRASQRMLSYFETGLRLFGHSFYDKRTVTLNDLEDCSAILDSRLVRLMPFEDDLGRPVIVLRKVADEGDEYTTKDLTVERIRQLGLNRNHFAKVHWYIVHAAMERGCCLQNGVVLFCDMRNTTPQHIRKVGPVIAQATADVESCVPLKIRARHIILEHNHLLVRVAIQALFSFFTLAAEKRFVLHARALEDNHQELNKRYGINVNILPADVGGTVDAEYFAHWLEERRAAGI